MRWFQWCLQIKSSGTIRREARGNKKIRKKIVYQFQKAISVAKIILLKWWCMQWIDMSFNWDPKSTGFASIFSSVTQCCPSFCGPIDCNTPGFPVHHQLPELAQTHVHWVSDAIQPSHPLPSPSPPARRRNSRVHYHFMVTCVLSSYPMTQKQTFGIYLIHRLASGLYVILEQMFLKLNAWPGSVKEFSQWTIHYKYS